MEEQRSIPRLYEINKASESFKMKPEQLHLRKYASKNLIPTSSAPILVAANVGTKVDMFSIGLSALALAQQMYGCTLDELLFRTEQEMRQLNTMAQEHPEKNISRRETLKFLIALPAALMGLSKMES